MAASDESKSVERFDERDTMFARAERRPGTAQYDDYYSRRPELRGIDDRLRELPGLLQPGGRYYDTDLALEAGGHFTAIERWAPQEEAIDAWRERLGRGRVKELDESLRQMAFDLGAIAVGVCTVDARHVYSFKGRHDADYGNAVPKSPPRALVFLVEMDHQAMAAAPRMPTIVESARQYSVAAEIARTIAVTLQAKGYTARPHYDAHYEVILPALAVAAGLGELGRNNILVADHVGARVRVGAVTTDAPLVEDEPRPLGVRRFCEQCKKCSDNCPSGALSGGAPETIRGVVKWPTRVEKCHGYWRRIGTDCGICMAVCPFSHRDDWFHSLVRWLVRRVPSSVPLALWGDDLVYGRRWRARGEE